jgi:DNA excision repair protein ERCC-6
LSNRGSILADEMGLGKTLSAISFLVCLKTSGKFGPTLVVCPATVINQWKDEIETWGESTFENLKIYTT